MLAGKVNLVVATEPATSPALSLIKIQESTLYVAYREDDELAKQQDVQLADISGRDWVMFAKSVHPLMYSKIKRRAEYLGVRSKDTHHIMAPDGLISSFIT